MADEPPLPPGRRLPPGEEEEELLPPEPSTLSRAVSELSIASTRPNSAVSSASDSACRPTA